MTQPKTLHRRAHRTLRLLLVAVLTLLVVLMVWVAGRQSVTRKYGETVIYDAGMPLPIPPLRFFAVDSPSSDVLVARVAAYCRDSREWLSRILREPHPMRTLALCGMYIPATNAPYGEIDLPETVADVARQPLLYCGTVVMAQSAIYTALGLAWEAHHQPEHVYLTVSIDGQDEVFDATVNYWQSADASRLFWIPDFPGAFDHTRYDYCIPCWRDELHTNVWRYPDGE